MRSFYGTDVYNRRKPFAASRLRAHILRNGCDAAARFSCQPVCPRKDTVKNKLHVVHVLLHGIWFLRVGRREKEMLRKKYHVVRKKNHVVRKIFYVASIFDGAAGRKNGTPWKKAPTAWKKVPTAG